MKRALCLALLLAGCATAEPRIEYREVLVPVAVPCGADVGAPPSYLDSNAALQEAPDLFERVKLLLAGREQRSARLEALEGQIAACRPTS
ncbi:hypothetical protein D3C72_480990 [compost metagenome]